MELDTNFLNKFKINAEKFLKTQVNNTEQDTGSTNSRILFISDYDCRYISC